ncbi:uncharacterized protein N7483_008174 [Penicillium malachiteum]|uniref:uncharacterized protein n=1 Tax=Penicillium malachiteum TaxID=1324776 RepID=UPI002549462A|nr:uncharacterized protein N7483_008174 [Penicillium malachiteum]KAJ5720240.1 hypothetical protein N7483_008174 [Penicillium malachiteum]
MTHNPLLEPQHYATPQSKSDGPPATYHAAQRTLKGYDYVIVGAGAAGCVLASKLSEDKDTSVLLLEAGADSANVLQAKVPLMSTQMFHSEYDWAYFTTEQPNLGSRQIYWPRGRIMGGSTSMNTMMYHHASSSDYDEWVSVHGCKGWGYDDLSPYFRRMEKFTPNPARPAINTEHRGSDGMWDTGYSYVTEIAEKAFLPSCEAVGIPINPDINTKDGTLGATLIQSNIDQKGQRASMSTAFLAPEVLKRPNLHVACHAHVTKVLFDTITTEAPTAIGVQLKKTRDGEFFNVHARREVILSGGSVNTPQTLLLSGVGPADELTSLGIPVVRDNSAVGKNLKDHLTTLPIICKANPLYTLDYLKTPMKALPALLQWKLFGTGPLTHNVGESAAFIRSADFEFPESSIGHPVDVTSGPKGPDLELLAVPLMYGDGVAPDGGGAITTGAIHLRPLSTGTITLKSRDAFEPPIIDPKYLSDESNNDLKAAVAGTRVALRVSRAAPFQKYLEPVPVNDDPTSFWWPYSCSDIEKVKDEDIIRNIKEKAFTLYHPVGTARMGPDPATSVVDLQCKVHGVKGLRVMDASVFPEQISGHTSAPVGALAFKLSEMIREGN